MIRFYKANIAGPYHIENGIPCQDSCYIKRASNGILYATVADGLGSESHSDIGSRIASQKSCDYCMEQYKSGMSFSEVKKIMNNAFVHAYKAVIEEAHSAGNSEDEYDTTLCLVIYDDGHLYYGHSGDSGILALMEDGEYIPLTTQQRDEDGYVFPLCSGPNRWVFGEVEGSVSSVMLMTDGVWEQLCPPLLRNHDIKVNIALASKFMDRQETSLRSVKALEEAAKEFLEYYPRRLLDDDKTIVVIYDPLKPAKKLPEEYYNAPNWAVLREEANACLYSNQCSKIQDEETNEQSSEPVENTDDLTRDKDDQGNKPIATVVAQETSRMSEKGQPNQDIQYGEITSGSSAHATRAGPTSRDLKGKQHPISFGNGPSLLRNNKTRAKLFDLFSVLILVVFSIIAFALNGFVKQHAPETYFGVFIVCFIANSTVLLPAPSILIVLQYSLILNPVIVALCGALGASLGEMIGFMTGSHGRHLVKGKLIKKIEERFPQHPYLFVLVFSALPLPLFDIVGILAGAIHLAKLKFFLVCFTGKSAKMLVFVWIGHIITTLLS